MSQQEHRRKSDNRGLHIGRINTVAAILAVILGLVILYTAYGTLRSYNAMQKATEEYIAFRTDASDMQAGSDFLTDRVRAFTVTGDLQHVRDFFMEIDETKRRDHALEHMGQELTGKEAYRYLSDALGYSNQLIQLERYSMRLAAEANDIPAELLPMALQETKLTEKDAALSDSEKIAAAQDLVFNNDYYEMKRMVSINVDRCVKALVEETRAQQTESAEDLVRLLRQQTVLITAMMILVAVLVLMNIGLVIIPLRKCVEGIKEQKELPMTGAYEIQFLTEAYNTVLLENLRTNELLSYEATHDALTGLYNRGAFENVKAHFNEGNGDTLLLIDVDEFKKVNDTYGHDIGDRVLQRVAWNLSKAFRSEDMVCRIGGDEFAVIMSHVDRSLQPTVEHKLNLIRKQLAVPEGDVPKATLSIGVAFCDRLGSTGDLYKDADTALYKVKNSGRDGIVFYEQKAESEGGDRNDG